MPYVFGIWNRWQHSCKSTPWKPCAGYLVILVWRSRELFGCHIKIAFWYAACAAALDPGAPDCLVLERLVAALPSEPVEGAAKARCACHCETSWGWQGVVLYSLSFQWEVSFAKHDHNRMKSGAALGSPFLHESPILLHLSLQTHVVCFLADMHRKVTFHQLGGDAVDSKLLSR